MNLHDILITIQYLGVFGLFVESFLVLNKSKNRQHALLFFSCVTALINNIGYLFELQATSEESFIIALQLSYAGRIWFGLSMFLFVSLLTEIRFPRVLTYLFSAMNMGTYISILAIKYNRLYYLSMEYVSDGVFPKLKHQYGILYYSNMFLNVFYLITGTVMLFMRLKGEDRPIAKKRLWIVMAAIWIQGGAFIIQVLHVFDITRHYDVTMLGYFAGTILMCIAIYVYDLLGTREIAREYVIDRISEAIIAVGNDGRVEYFNEPALKLYPGLAKKDEQSSVVNDIDEALRKKDIIRLNDRIFTAEANDLMFEEKKYGKLYALVDETEHYGYMDALQKQRDIADNANEAKSRFLANMSHEIRTPINAVLGMDEMILREAEDDSIRSYASDIMSAGKTLLSLINDILDLSKVEEGKMEIIPIQYELSSLVNDLMNMTRERAEKKGLKLELDIMTDIPNLLIGDEIRIRQCVVNLLTNAVKYTEKGSVVLRISYGKLGNSQISLEFSVEDTGIGMKPEDIERLCTPYERIEESRNRAIEGTGLGMSITKELLSLMDSELYVASEYGKGTKISFSILQDVVNWEEIGDLKERFENDKTRKNDYKELLHAPNARILVVDDTEMNLTVMEHLLKKTEIKIDSVRSGKEAIELCRMNTYDILFIDHMMPEMDGIETLELIHKDGLNTNTPSVALTANAISGARKMYLDVGFTDYLAKPVEGKKLEKMIISLLPESKLDDLTEADLSNGQSEKDDEEKLPDWLYEISYLDPDAGLLNCGNVEGYLSVLSTFYRTAAAKSDEIEAYYKAGDIENYTIMVHALKSSSRIIGAADISELAKELEAAGKENDTEAITAGTDTLLLLYRSLSKMLSPIDDKDDSLPKIDKSAMREAYQTILEISGVMDFGLMDDIIHDLKNYSLPPEDEKRVFDIEDAFNQLNWDAIMEMANEALG